jgi:hypothetical protein
LGRDSDTTDASDDVAVAAEPENEEAAAEDATQEQTGTATDDGAAEDAVDPSSFTGMVTMEVPMKDIFTFDGTQAAGTAQVTINSVTGETCASVTTSNVSGPYNSHIHLGAYPERGPIVVDFEPMTDGAERCVANDVTDINEILADRSEFYVEMHDAGGVYTVRGQLSEATVFDDMRDPALIPQLDDDSEVAFDTDPDGGGAIVRFQSSSLLVQAGS